MLNPKQERFCQDYVIDLNATQAAIRAGYSEKTAYSIGQRLLKNVEVQRRIGELQKELQERNRLKADDVINELRALAFWSINDFVDTGNAIKDISGLDRATNRPVVGIKTKRESKTFEGVTTVEQTTEIKFADKRASLVDLGRHLGIFKEDNDQKAIKIKVTRK